MFPNEIWQIIGELIDINIYKFCFINRALRRIFAEWIANQDNWILKYYCEMAMVQNIPQFFAAINICDREFIVDHFDYIRRSIAICDSEIRGHNYGVFYCVVSRGELLHSEDLSFLFDNVRNIKFYDAILEKRKESGVGERIRQYVSFRVCKFIEHNDYNIVLDFIAKHGINLSSGIIIILVGLVHSEKTNSRYQIDENIIGGVFDEVDRAVVQKRTWRTAMYEFRHSDYVRSEQNLLMRLAQKKYLQNCSAAEISSLDKIVEEDGKKYLCGIDDSNSIRLFND